MVWGYGDGWCRVVWEVVVREVGLRVEVSITRSIACEGSACPSAEACVFGVFGACLGPLCGTRAVSSAASEARALEHAQHQPNTPTQSHPSPPRSHGSGLV